MDANNGLLWQCPPIVKNIFKFLSAKDLSSCAKVCSLWHSMSISENNRRRLVVQWFLEVEIGQKVDMDGKTISDIPPPGQLYPFQKQLASVRTKPHFCLAFITEQTLDHFEEVFPSFEASMVPRKDRKRKRLNLKEITILKLKSMVDNFLHPLLPMQCQVHCITTPGIIGCHENCSPSEVEGSHAISGILLPHFPGVTIHHFPMELPCRFNTKALPPPPIKCLLMFANMLAPTVIQNIIDTFYAYNSYVEFAIGGALVDSALAGVGSCFAFAGENLEAASVVIDESTNDVGYELALFKKTGLLKNQCFAFIFSCVDKGIAKYLVPNYESSIFRNMYPDVPLTGVFGYGEIGVHSLPNVDEEDSDHKQRRKKFHRKKCVRAYNSVFVLLSVKTPN